MQEPTPDDAPADAAGEPDEAGSFIDNNPHELTCRFDAQEGSHLRESQTSNCTCETISNMPSKKSPFRL